MRPWPSWARNGWPRVGWPSAGWPRIGRPAIGWPHVLLIVALLAPVHCLAAVAELDGVQLPLTIVADGKTLYLNGLGLRTYSIFRVHIYVAGLYLEHQSTDASTVLQSPETKLLRIQFVHNVSANAARDAWRKGLENNCPAPCHLDPADVARFLSEVPDMHAGERFSILFTQQGATVTADATSFGTISKPQFVSLMLATFLGPRPASNKLKAELLQGHD
jgi:hypothetical protein